jgi:hypothetical protein
LSAHGHRLPVAVPPVPTYFPSSSRQQPDNCELICFTIHIDRNEKRRCESRIYESVGSLHRLLVTSKGTDHLIFHKDELPAIL